MGRAEREYYIAEDPVCVELSKLTEHYPSFDWMHETCAFCGLPALYLLCGRFDHEHADYEPRNSYYRMAVFELRSQFDTNFEFPVCETHIYGEPE